MRNVSFRLVLTACFAILFFAHSDLLGQGGVGGSNDFARSAAPAGSGTSNGVWSDGAWITSSGANSAGPQAGDTIFIGDSTAVSPPAGTPPNFTGTVEVDVDGGGFGGPFTSRTVAEAHLGNVAAGDTGILNLNSGVDLNVTGDVNMNQGSLNLSNGDLSAANIFVNGGTLDVDAGQTVTATTLTFDSAASTGDLDGIVNVTNLNVLGGANVDFDGVVNALDVTIEDSSVTIHDDDSASDVSITMGGTLIFNQDPGDTTGLALDTLDIEAGSKLELGFDASTAIQTDDADWVLSVMGNQFQELWGFIRNGQLVSSNPTYRLGVFYNAGTNTSYVTAVPEPGTFGVLCLLGGLATIRRRRS